MFFDVEDGRALARHIPDARLIEYPGEDHLPFVGDNVDEILADIRDFIAHLPTMAIVDRTLATLPVARLDVPGAHPLASTNQTADHRQRNRMFPHALPRYRGKEIELSDDRVIAAFDGPARALQCAINVVEEFDRFNLPVRIGVHTGELHIKEGDISGVALDIASSVADVAEESGVIASRTVEDLVARSGIGFQHLGEYPLPAFSEPWRMFQVINSPH